MFTKIQSCYVKGASEMAKEEKLAVLNSIPVNNYDTDSDAVYTVTCIDNVENREKISKLGYSNEEINRFISFEQGFIEMTHFAWEIATSAELGDNFKRWCID